MMEGAGEIGGRPRADAVPEIDSCCLDALAPDPFRSIHPRRTRLLLYPFARTDDERSSAPPASLAAPD